MAETKNDMKRNLLVSILSLIISITFISAQKQGKASYYSHKLHGNHTSDGGKYHRDSLTCAHRTYPFGTLLKVRNLKTDKVVIVKVTDRGPHQKRLLIDLSYSAAKELGIIQQGIATVEITRMDSTSLADFLTQYSIIANKKAFTDINSSK